MVERVALSLTSDDLRLMRHACPLDKVIASGWSSKTDTLGCLAFWAKYACDAGRTRDLFRQARKVAVARARRKKRGGHADHWRAMSDVAVEYWLQDTCGACQGRGFKVAEGSQIASGELCGACHGSGLAPLPSASLTGSDMDEQRFGRAVLEMLSSLDQAMSGYVARTLASLRNK
jgi:hypothetical protein